MATIRKRKDKYVVIYDYINSNGERKQKWETFENKSDADKRVKQVEYEKSLDNFIAPNDQTVTQFFEEWVRFKAKTQWQYKTYMGNVQMIEHHILPIIGNVVLQKLTPKHVDMLFVRLRTKSVTGSKARGKSEDKIPYLSSTTQRHVYSLLKSAMDKAVEWKVISKNPVECDPPKRSTTETTSWDIDTFKMALDMIEDDILHLAVHTAFIGSMRIGEAMALSWDDINFEKGEFYISKNLQRVDKSALNEIPKDYLYFAFPTVQEQKKSVLILKKPKTEKSRRTIYLTDELQDELVRRRLKIEAQKRLYGDKYTDYNLVFALEDGRPIEPKLCEKWFKKWQNGPGLAFPDVVFHSIRHSSATYKLKLSHGDIKSVQGDTGHASAKMLTDVYAHIQSESRKELSRSIEKDFYQKEKTEDSEKNISADKEKISSAEINNMLLYLENNPDLKNQLLAGLFAQNNTKV